MPAYFRSLIRDFLSTSDETVLAKLTTAYANDGYVAQYTAATVAWTVTLPALRTQFDQLIQAEPSAQTWQLLLEFPLYRLRRRIDAVVISPSAVVVIELKTGAAKFEAADKRQVIEYAQDLRDFHAASRTALLYPLIWSLEANVTPTFGSAPPGLVGVGPLGLVGTAGLASALLEIAGPIGFNSAEASDAQGRTWDEAAYAPVPAVIEAAVTLFSGHGVREITLAGSKNLREAADAVFSIIQNVRAQSRHAVVFLTGVPGAGKTLAGLNIVHSAIDRGLSDDGDVVYLSGNTPLVVVLREALARDQHRRKVAAGDDSTLRDARSSTRATIQHVNDFLKQYVHANSEPPSGHVIVFDEAQRAWDARQGKEKFGREASEPLLILEAMARHTDWSVTVCLIGLGQEINDGEEGISGWAEAVTKLSSEESARWSLFAPSAVFGDVHGAQTIGSMPAAVVGTQDQALHLDVPMRSFRSPNFGEWIDAVLVGDLAMARQRSVQMSYPLYVTRSLETARQWLKRSTHGERRMGLLASSGARRLRADGIGEVLSATDGSAIAHWYLNPPGDIRSSFALEVPANEYTSQGLELDFACLCWGGDLIRRHDAWIARSLAGNRWNEVDLKSKRFLFILNSYRVLLSRAREGLVIWVPRGELDDDTRRPEDLDGVVESLIQAGAADLDR